MNHDRQLISTFDIQNNNVISERKNLFPVVDLMPGSQLHQLQVEIKVLTFWPTSKNRNKDVEPHTGTLKFFTETTLSDLVHCTILTLQEGYTYTVYTYISVSMTC